MKRPQGFDRPSVTATRTTPSPARPSSAAGLTEPIPLVRPPVREPAIEASPASVGDAEVRRAARDRRRYERNEMRRFTAAGRRRRRRVLIGVGAVVGVLGLVAAVAFSPATAVRVIQVEGASRVPAASIVAALGDQLGTPLPLVSGDAVHDELAAFTLIQSYSMEAKLPDTLVVRIVERDPIGAVKTATGFDLIDSAGVVIASSAEIPAGYPQLETANPVAVEAAGEVIRSLPADVRAQLAKVRAQTRDDVTLTLASGPTVVWGSADDSVTKAAVFASLLAVAPGASRYDVSAPDNPVYS